MKTTFEAKWVAPLIGVAVVGVGLLAATNYVNLEQQAAAAQAVTVTLDRLYQDQRMGAVLKAMHEGEVGAAAQRLDVLLCQDILRLNSQLSEADPSTQAFINDAFCRIAMLRPKPGVGAGSGEYMPEQAAAERILSLAAGGGHVAQTQ